MVEGGLDAVVLHRLRRPGAARRREGYDQRLRRQASREVRRHSPARPRQIAPDKIGLALTAADVRAASTRAGKKVALIGVENGYPLGTDLTRVKEFYDRGARYMSLAHNGHSQLSDSNTGERRRLDVQRPVAARQAGHRRDEPVGIMIDVSHPSKESMMQAIALSKAPIIASHSGVRALCNHSRNLDDEQLLALKKNGGVVQTVAFASYVKIDRRAGARRGAAALRKEFGLPRHAARRPAADAAAVVAARPRLPGGGAGPHAGPGAAPRRRGRQGAACVRSQLSDERRANFDKRIAESTRSSRRRRAHGQGLRRSHRLRRQEDRHRPRRHLVRLRRRRRRRRLERRRRDLQRHARTGAPRLHRRADREDLERQPAARHGRGRENREAHTGGRTEELTYGTARTIVLRTFCTEYGVALRVVWTQECE